MAQIIELLGDFPLEVKMGGKYSRELFDHTGTSLAPVSARALNSYFTWLQVDCGTSRP
jgi:hypothetical protein